MLWAFGDVAKSKVKLEGSFCFAFNLCALKSLLALVIYPGTEMVSRGTANATLPAPLLQATGYIEYGDLAWKYVGRGEICQRKD